MNIVDMRVLVLGRFPTNGVENRRRRLGKNREKLPRWGEEDR